MMPTQRRRPESNADLTSSGALSAGARFEVRRPFGPAPMSRHQVARRVTLQPGKSSRCLRRPAGHRMRRHQRPRSPAAAAPAVRAQLRQLNRRRDSSPTGPTAGTDPGQDDRGMLHEGSYVVHEPSDPLVDAPTEVNHGPH